MVKEQGWSDRNMPWNLYPYIAIPACNSPFFNTSPRDERAQAAPKGSKRRLIPNVARRSHSAFATHLASSLPRDVCEGQRSSRSRVKATDITSSSSPRSWLTTLHKCNTLKPECLFLVRKRRLGGVTPLLSC